jgi:hypothetical protein
MNNVLNNLVLSKRNSGQYVDVSRLKQVFYHIGITRLKPATLAVLIQGLAFMMVLASLWAIQTFFEVVLDVKPQFTILELVLSQALFASVLSYLTSMASWWRWIHLCFPITMFLMLNWHIPNELYLAGFIFSLSLFWTTFRTQVPFFPSRPVVWKQVAQVLPKDRPVRLIDIGSGLGDMPMYIAQVRSDSAIEGIEIAPLPWIISVIRSKMRRSRAAFTLGDYRALDFANYDVVFAYLSPAAMLALWDKARHEMKPGSLLISVEFDIPGVEPSIRIAGNGNSSMLYVWKIA